MFEYFIFFFFFFFSSRRRHTRSLRDWSSDVCSSDLLVVFAGMLAIVRGVGAGGPTAEPPVGTRSEEHTSELQSRRDLVCRLLLEKKKKHARPRSPSSGLLPPHQAHAQTALATPDG